MAGTLTITSPATDSQSGISTSSVPVSWSFAGTGGAVQTQRRVTSTPVGSSSAVFDTGMAASTETSHTVGNFATGVSYNVTVTVVDSVGATLSATRVIVSNYTRPLPPVLTADPSEQCVNITVTNPVDGSRPTVTTNTLYRRFASSGSDWTVVGTGGANAVISDYTAAAGTIYEYFARANGQVDSSVLTVTTSAMAGAWIHETQGSASGTLQHFPYAVAAGETIDQETAFHAFVGRPYPVAEVGAARQDVLSVSLRLPPEVRRAGEDAWRDWKRRAPILFYRDGRGRAWPVNIDGAVQAAPDSAGSTVTATLRRVDYSPATLPAGAYNYQTNVDGGYGVGGYGSNGYGL